MPVPGVKPTDGPKRHRGAAHTEWIEVADVPFDGPSPDLPSELFWPDQTRAWYEVVRHLPHACTWGDGEWQEILTTALVHAAVWREPENPPSNKIAELRQREKQIGMTADQRRDLRIRYFDKPVEKAEEETPNVVPFLRVRPKTDALET